MISIVQTSTHGAGESVPMAFGIKTTRASRRDDQSGLIDLIGYRLEIEEDRANNNESPHAITQTRRI